VLEKGIILSSSGPYTVVIVKDVMQWRSVTSLLIGTNFKGEAMPEVK
jgi:hypothetical protein